MSCLTLIDTYLEIRDRFASSVEDVGIEEALWIPPGYRNNILWQLGHIAVTQRLLTYGLARQPVGVADEDLALFRRGTSPGEWEEPPQLDHALRLLRELPAALRPDYQAGHFDDFEGYTTSAGIALRDIESAVTFVVWHEGMHVGHVAAMRRMWAQANPGG